MNISTSLNEVLEYLGKLSNDTNDHMRCTGDILMALSEFTNVGLDDLKGQLKDILSEVEDLENKVEELKGRILELEENAHE